MPDQLRLHLIGGGSLTMDWGSGLTAVVEQPGGTFANNGGTFSGTWIGGTATAQWGALYHLDTSRACR
jgi:hypothetical protein